MRKEFLLVSMPKLILAVVFIVGIGAVMGLMGYYWTMPKSEVVIDNKIEKTEKQEQKIANAQIIILSDEGVYEILKEFINKDSELFSEKMEKYNKILADALEFKNEITKEEIVKIEKDLKEEGKMIQDAPDMRSFYTAHTKVCIAKSIVYDDLKNTCGINEDSFLDIDDIDDLIAVEQILPHLIVGLAYYSEGDYSKSNHYFNQIKLHYQALESSRYGSNLSHLLLYNRVYNKAVSFIEVANETADWKTYRNEEYGFEFKYPSDHWDLTERKNNLFVLSDDNINKATGTEFEILFEKNGSGGALRVMNKTIEQAINYRSSSFGTKTGKAVNIGGIIGEELYGASYGMKYVNNNGKTYFFELINTLEEDDWKKYDEMIKSFKFIEKDETANWQTYNTQLSSLNLYKNLDNPFMFKYPKNWFLVETKGGIDIYSFQSTGGYGIGTLQEDQFKAEIWRLDHPNNPNNLGILEWCNKKLDSYDYSYNKIIFSRQEKIINDFNIAEIEFEFDKWKNINGKFVCFAGKRNNNIVILGHPLNSKYMKTFNKILSTFKFIEE